MGKIYSIEQMPPSSYKQQKLKALENVANALHNCIT